MGAHLINVVTFKWVTPGYRSQFTAEYVNIFAAMLARNSTAPYKLWCITDDADGLDSSIEPIELWPNPVPSYGDSNAPNCFRRLFMFSRDIAEALGPRWMWSDLDSVITGNIDHILTDEADFKIWRPTGDTSRCNGSLVLHRAGSMTQVWDEFSPAKVGTIEEFRAQTNHLGSDQAWMSRYLTPETPTFGESDGVFAFRKLRNQALERFVAKQEKEEARGRKPRNPLCYTRDVAARRERRDSRREQREKEKLTAALPPQARLVYFPGQQHPWDARVQKLYPWVKQHWRE